MPTTVAELSPIESYLDTMPRAAATVEQVGPFSLFVSTAAFPLYARPTPAVGAGRIAAADVAAVRARQRELGVPEAFEWVDEIRPELGDLVRATGLAVYRLALMVHRDTYTDAPPEPPGIRIRVLDPDDPGLPSVQAAIGLGLATPGTAVGPVGDSERRDAETTIAGAHSVLRRRIARGEVVLAGAFTGGSAVGGAVGGGSHAPLGAVTEITGVATLPAYRRRGIGAAVSATLTAEAYRRGVQTCFLSAGSPVVGRVYQRAGFRRIGTACVAGAPA